MQSMAEKISCISLPLISFLILILYLICVNVESSTAGSIGAFANLTGESPFPLKEDSSNTTARTKIWKLKELLAEVKRVAVEIKQERKRKRKEKLLKNGKSIPQNNHHSFERQLKKLRKKMHTKLQRITERLREVEVKMREWQKESRNRKQQQQRMVKQKAATIKPIESTTDDAIKRKTGKGRKIMNGNPTIAPSSGGTVVRKVQIRRRGEEGNICGHHGDCGPGHCCQWDSHSNEEPKCVAFNRKEGDQCEHSCSCEAQLQCFRANSVESVPNKAFCKKASSTDLLNGRYENAKKSVFQIPSGKNDDAKREEDTEAIRLPTKI